MDEGNFARFKLTKSFIPDITTGRKESYTVNIPVSFYAPGADTGIFRDT